MSSRDDILSQRYESDEPDKRPIKEIRDNYQIWAHEDSITAFAKQYKRLDFEFEDRDFEIEKMRHFHPVVLHYGLDAVSDMDPDDFLDALDELEQRDLV